MNLELKNRIQKVAENANYLDKRAYFTVNGDGDIKRKSMNLIVPAIAFCSDEKLFLETLEKEIDKKETLKEKGIDRMSSLKIEDIKEKLPKLIIKGELEFAKKYAKELALRDRDSLIEIMFNLSLMDNINFRKPLMALALEKILKDYGWDDKVCFLIISYFTKQRYDLNTFENAGEIEKINLEINNSLELKAYSKVLIKKEYKNEKKYMYMLSKEIEKNQNNQLTKIEKEILENI